MVKHSFFLQDGQETDRGLNISFKCISLMTELPSSRLHLLKVPPPPNNYLRGGDWENHSSMPTQAKSF
jgi:hypothetical protein